MARKILVVEDETPIREMLEFVLDQNGYQPILADSFDAGLAAIREPYPELILLDWMLPGGSGIQLAKQLKQNELTRNIPIIMLTARGEEEDKGEKDDGKQRNGETRTINANALETIAPGHPTVVLVLRND